MIPAPPGLTRPPNSIIVGISDAAITRDASTSIVTYGLGSCIAICVFDPVAQVGGLAHVMLPDSEMDGSKAEANPFIFADTGVRALVRRAAGLGANPSRLAVAIAGGAQVMDDAGVFNIGKRNHLAVRRALWKAGLLIQAEAIGGDVARTVWLEVGAGRFWVREGGGEAFELPLGGGVR
jgi:chemotaxis protein CheD